MRYARANGFRVTLQRIIGVILCSLIHGELMAQLLDGENDKAPKAGMRSHQRLSSVVNQTGAAAAGTLRSHSDRVHLIRLLTSESNGQPFVGISVQPLEINAATDTEDSFGLSTVGPSAKAWFDRGLFHLYQYEDDKADRCFLKVALLSPDCPMAYWGMSIANSHDPTLAKSLLADAADLVAETPKNKPQISLRERRYLEASIAQHMPVDDVDRVSGSQDQYVAALESILTDFPDDRHAELLLGRVLFEQLATSTKSGERSQKIEFSPNLWHLNATLAARGNRLDEAIWYHEASLRSDNQYLAQTWLFPDRLHSYARNNRRYIQILRRSGRVHEAIALARYAISLPRHPQHNPFPGGKRNAGIGRTELWKTLRDFELWDDLLTESRLPSLSPTSDPEEKVCWLRMVGIAFFQTGRAAEGVGCINQLKTMDLGLLPNQVSATRRNAVLELEFLELVKSGQKAAARNLFDQMTDLEPQTAIEYRSWIEDKGVLHDDLIRLIQANFCDAQWLAKGAAILWSLGARSEAQATYRTLYELTGPLEANVPLFAKLDVISAVTPPDSFTRSTENRSDQLEHLPPLSSLGPIHWQPPRAKSWSLPDSTGVDRSSEQFRGSPRIVIFYLGGGCLHCVEQLQAFAPKTPEFADAGIQLMAIGTDRHEDLKKATIRYNEKGEFPFPLLSDEKFTSFRNYGLFNETEKQPLHGVFLIDRHDRILWQDTGREPFMDVDFLLTEARRLLLPENNEP